MVAKDYRGAILCHKNANNHRFSQGIVFEVIIKPVVIEF